MPDQPDIHPEFPIRDPDQLSSPVVSKPIYECAEAVHVYGFVPHALVEVFANGAEPIGKDNPPFGFADIRLFRPLKLGEKITATQTVGAVTSDQSIQPVEVLAYPPGGFKRPVVAPDIYECGVVVPVDQLVPSVRVHVQESGVEIGSAPVAQSWTPVVTTKLNAGKPVIAEQIACEKEPAHAIKSPPSDPPTIVKPAPNPVPTPVVDKKSFIVGNDTATLGNLYVGAAVSISDNGIVVSSGQFATAPSNLVPLDRKIVSTSKLTSTQELCGRTSLPSEPVEPTSELQALKVVEPICPDSQFVVIRNSVVNANVVLFRNGGIVGYGGAVVGDLVLAVGRGIRLNPGDSITALQSGLFHSK
jgi:hypothetical protein